MKICLLGSGSGSHVDEGGEMDRPDSWTSGNKSSVQERLSQGRLRKGGI